MFGNIPGRLQWKETGIETLLIIIIRYLNYPLIKIFFIRNLCKYE